MQLVSSSPHTKHHRFQVWPERPLNQNGDCASSRHHVSVPALASRSRSVFRPAQCSPPDSDCGEKIRQTHALRATTISLDGDWNRFTVQQSNNTTMAALPFPPNIGRGVQPRTVAPAVFPWFLRGNTVHLSPRMYGLGPMRLTSCTEELARASEHWRMTAGPHRAENRCGLCLVVSEAAFLRGVRAPPTAGWGARALASLRQRPAPRC